MMAELMAETLLHILCGGLVQPVGTEQDLTRGMLAVCYYIGGDSPGQGAGADNGNGRQGGPPALAQRIQQWLQGNLMSQRLPCGIDDLQ